MSYNQAADDVVLLKGLPKLLRHTLGRLFAFAGVRKGELLLACKTEAHLVYCSVGHNLTTTGTVGEGFWPSRRQDATGASDVKPVLQLGGL